MELDAREFGQAQEEDVAAAYEDLATELGWHQNVVLEWVGLKIPPGHGHIGASVDQMVKCSCHPN